MSNSSSRPIHKHPAFWGLFIIVALFFVDIIQIKSWFGELAEDKKEHKMNQAKLAKIKQENKEAINTVYNVAFGERNTLNDLITYLKESLSEFDSKIKDIQVAYGPNRLGDIPHSLASIDKANRTSVDSFRGLGTIWG